MNWTVQLTVPLLSLLLIGGMLMLCLRSGPATAAAAGRREYRVHGAWYVFAAVGGALLVGVFALAAQMAPPEDRSVALGCSVGSAVFFLFFAWVLRSLRVVVDKTSVTVHNLFGAQTASLAEIERVAVVGMMVELRRRADPSGGRPARPIIFLAAFRNLREMMATIRARAGIPEA